MVLLGKESIPESCLLSSHQRTKDPQSDMSSPLQALDQIEG